MLADLPNCQASNEPAPVRKAKGRKASASANGAE
jgi:hypothetical protein